MIQEQRRIYLIQELLKERGEADYPIPQDEQGQKHLLRALMNIRDAQEASEKFLATQDAYLRQETEAKGIVDVNDLTPLEEGLYLWQGDITRLRCDAIVNAANSGMTGCYVPNHRCIDNCIHTFSGIQLRMDCDRIMRQQGVPEPTGRAKITTAYNLPCKYILHTVGPIVRGEVSGRDEEFLRSCYNACLELATERGLESVAFCCISTGEFHFPNQRAAEIAVDAVRQFMKKETSIRKVIFNVFKDYDKEIYQQLLAKN